MGNTSKFHELCNEYKLARKKYFDYRQDCERFTSYLITEMIGNFQCPSGAIKTFSVNSENISNVRGAISLEDDGFWHLGIKFSLYEEPYSDLSPNEVVLLHLLIKREDGHFIVKLGDDGSEFKVNKNQSDTLGTFYQSGELKPFYQHIYEQIKSDFQNQPQRFEEERLLRKIGFQ